MVLIDTSVFIALYRRRDEKIGRKFQSLIEEGRACICGAIWVEFVGGFRSSRRRSEMADRMATFDWLSTSREAYELAATWFASATLINSTDAIIAATAATNGADLLTLDRGFRTLRQFGLNVISDF